MGLLEKSLADTFVDDDQGDLGALHRGGIYAGFAENAVLFGNDAV